MNGAPTKEATSSATPIRTRIDATFKNATATNHTVSMSGGSDKIRFYTSFGYLNNPGVMPNAGFSRYSARVSVDADVTKWLTIGALASGYRGETQPGARVQDDIFTYASATTPGMVFLAPDGRFGAMNNTEDDSPVCCQQPHLACLPHRGQPA